ncbi:MAG: protein translocase subunit SecF [Ktedonobacteraceae bacterium]|nr:protein translocase subunit SecF [Ktedonobacteraceae bacterium]
MFNLVKYRYLFLIISLIVIIPGLISLIFTGLNVGIDFAGGASVEFRPQAPLSSTGQVMNLLKPLNLKDLTVVLGDNKTQPANNTIWILLNTQVDQNVEQYIQNTLSHKYPGAIVNPYPLPLAQPATLLTLVMPPNSSTLPQTSDVQALLNKLPNTSDPSKGPPSATPSSTPTASVAAGKGTPIVSRITPTATTAASNPATIPVSVSKVVQGTTTQTVTILTSTPIKTDDLPKLMAASLNGGGPYLQLISNSEVSGSVAGETTRNAFLAVVAASVAILLYVWFSFRKVPKPWRYGACAIIALLHDVLVVVGIFSILGWAFHIQVDALFITALLTVVGFSVHDTIVVFDRIRENMQRRTVETFEQVVNASLVQTLSRSLNTSLTVLFTLSALTLFGGESIRTFTLTLLIGIFSGTYSSIFNASMLLVIWERGELGFDRFNRDKSVKGRDARELARTGR